MRLISVAVLSCCVCIQAETEIPADIRAIFGLSSAQADRITGSKDETSGPTQDWDELGPEDQEAVREGMLTNVVNVPDDVAAMMQKAVSKRDDGASNEGHKHKHKKKDDDDDDASDNDSDDEDDNDDDDDDETKKHKKSVKLHAGKKKHHKKEQDDEADDDDDDTAAAKKKHHKKDDDEDSDDDDKSSKDDESDDKQEKSSDDEEDDEPPKHKANTKKMSLQSQKAKHQKLLLKASKSQVDKSAQKLHHTLHSTKNLLRSAKKVKHNVAKIATTTASATSSTATTSKHIAAKVVGTAVVSSTTTTVAATTSNAHHATTLAAKNKAIEKNETRAKTAALVAEAPKIKPTAQKLEGEVALRKRLLAERAPLAAAGASLDVLNMLDKQIASLRSQPEVNHASTTNSPNLDKKTEVSSFASANKSVTKVVQGLKRAKIHMESKVEVRKIKSNAEDDDDDKSEDDKSDEDENKDGDGDEDSKSNDASTTLAVNNSSSVDEGTLIAEMNEAKATTTTTTTTLDEDSTDQTSEDSDSEGSENSDGETNEDGTTKELSSTQKWEKLKHSKSFKKIKHMTSDDLDAFRKKIISDNSLTKGMTSSDTKESE